MQRQEESCCLEKSRDPPPWFLRGLPLGPCQNHRRAQRIGGGQVLRGVIAFATACLKSAVMGQDTPGGLGEMNGAWPVFVLSV